MKHALDASALPVSWLAVSRAHHGSRVLLSRTIEGRSAAAILLVALFDCARSRLRRSLLHWLGVRVPRPQEWSLS